MNNAKKTVIIIYMFDSLKFLSAHLPDKNRVDSDLTNTRTPKNHFPKIVHKIACWKNINSGKVVLSPLTTGKKSFTEKITRDNILYP